MWKTIFITGPTASGKSDLAIYLAKKFKGEIINADSRQVYKNLDVGSGKWDTGRKVKITVSEQKSKDTIQINGVTFHLLSIAHPRRNYSLGRWLIDANKAVRKIIKKGKVPIFCGGTILYLKAIKEGWVLPKVKPNYKLRKELEKKTHEELYEEIKKFDPQRAKNLDPENKRRLIRALEIIYTLGKVPKIKKEPKYEVLILSPKFWDDTQTNTDKDNLPGYQPDMSPGLEPDKSGKHPGSLSGKHPGKNTKSLRKSAFNTLSSKIKRRLLKTVPGIIREIKKLRRIGLSYKRIISFGLEYKWFGLYAEQADLTQTRQKNIEDAEQADLTQKRQKNSAKSAFSLRKSAFISACYKDILRFAKRQIRGLRKIEGVVYVKNKKETVQIVENFLKK